ncbi:hypothetical protein [Acidiferrobacter sp.]|uniref:LpxL/LpxP family acyltransferase n=1 Tax=Acidiferrobacter sp. TaxID=1872107 RepID=UPI0026385A43|nr:hypothetical protein [Acidiferrobacter sp.]
MAQAWFEKRERGSHWSLRTARTLALRLGRRTARVWLMPVTAYFFCASREGRAGLRHYYQALDGRRPTLARLFRHFLTFARTILDRAYLLARHRDAPHYEIRGFEAVTSCLDRGQGAILLGAHLGSFEAARAAAFLRPGLKVRVIMHTGVSRTLNEIVTALRPETRESVVRLDGPAALLGVREFLGDGGLIGLMGDRTVEGEATYPAEFLGATARFPMGPVRLAAALRAPVFFFTALYRGPVEGICRYELVFEPLCGPAPDAPARAEWMRQLGERYAQILEKYCRLAPDNWFNFYDFWQTPDARASHPRPGRDPDGRECVRHRPPLDGCGVAQDRGARGPS